MNIDRIIKVEPEPLERRRRTKSRIFVWNEDENIVQQVARRNTRNLDTYSRLIPEAVKKAGLKGLGEFGFSTRACTCGCSPGFINDGWLRDAGGIPYDLHILVKPSAVNHEPKVTTEGVRNEARGEVRSFAPKGDREDRKQAREDRRVPREERVAMAAKKDERPRFARTPREQRRNRSERSSFMR